MTKDEAQATLTKYNYCPIHLIGNQWYEGTQTGQQGYFECPQCRKEALDQAIAILKPEQL